MEINLKTIVDEMGLQDEIYIKNNCKFNYFSRLSTVLEGSKCVFITSKKYVKELDDSVAMIITSQEISEEIDDGKYGIAVTDNPRGLFFELLSYYEKKNESPLKKTRIGKNCQISNTAIIAEYGVDIGDDTYIGDYVVIHSNTSIGNNCIIQTGCKIAEQDLNVYNYKGINKQIRHNGRVIIGNNVLFSPGACVGKALYSYGITSIGDNCLIGTNAGVGHNTKVGSNCEICANSAIGGYCIIEDDATLFLSTTVANNIRIGKKAKANIGSVVVRDIPDGRIVFGNPAKEIG